MGLGRINPGCGCSCQIRVPLDSPCRIAAQHYRPISLVLNTPNYGGANPSTCTQDQIWTSCGPMPSNPPSVQINFSPYDHPNIENVCSVIVNSRTNTPVGNDCLTQSCCYGMWPVFTSSGGALIGFVNNVSTSIVYPYYAEASATVNYDRISERFFISVSVRADALMYRLSADSFVGQWLGANTSGQNWVLESQYQNGPFFVTKVFRETNGPTTRVSRFSVLAQFGISSDPKWCTWPVSGGYRYQMQAISGYTIYDDDPLWRSQRTFDIWTPSPALDGVGVTLGVSATLNTAV